MLVDGLPWIPTPKLQPESEALNRALAYTSDWPKRTLDLPVKSAEELRFFLLNRGETIEHFKTLPAYRYALASGDYPWLADL